jgi:hypothetical protein
VVNDRHSISAAAIEGAAWTKSSYSGGGNSQCVEIANIPAPSGSSGIAVRDSKDPDGPALLFAPESFASFITSLNAGRLA